VGFGDFARNAAPGLLQLLRQAEIHEGLIVDLGCGSGLWAQELVQAGYQTLGIDISAGMLSIARKRVPQATFRQSSFLDAELPECEAITAIGEVFNYLFDDNVQLRSLIQVFRRIHKSLRPGGLLIFDVSTPGRGGGPERRVRNWESDDWALMLRVEEDETRNILTRRMTTFRKKGKLYRRDHEVHRLRLYRPSDVSQALRKIGFRVRYLNRYGSFPMLPGMKAFVAKKI
jgi:SAM-dependent methyltransferase